MKFMWMISLADIINYNAMNYKTMVLPNGIITEIKIKNFKAIIKQKMFCLSNWNYILLSNKLVKVKKKIKNRNALHW